MYTYAKKKSHQGGASPLLSCAGVVVYREYTTIDFLFYDFTEISKLLLTGG